MINDLFFDKELIVRKKLTSFIEKLFKYYKYDFEHNIFKKVVYGEDYFKTPLEEKFKTYYDAYYYLISNYQNPLTTGILNKFIFLIVDHEVDKSLLIKITSQYFSLRFDLHEIILNHLLLLQELTSFTDFDKLFISLSIFNYSLLKLNIPTLKFSSKNLQEYEKLKKDYFLKKNKKIFAYLSNLIVNNPCQDKSYYQNLKPITLTKLKNQLLKNKTILKNKFSITNLYIFGSFAKEIDRIDSDLDLLIRFKSNLSKEEKLHIINELSNIYFLKFHRFIDFKEIGKYLLDNHIKELHKIIKIF